MFENRGKGVKRNETIIPYERPTKAARIDREEDVQAQDKIPGQGQSQCQPTDSIPSYDIIETYETSIISMGLDGDCGQTRKQSFIESIYGCPTDLNLICSDGVADVHRLILMGVSEFFFQLLRDRDPKDTEAITLVDVSIVHLSLALELIYTGATMVKGSEEEDGVREVLNLFGIKLQLERKEATDEDLSMRASLQQAETEEEDEGTSENEAENSEAPNSNTNAHNAVEELDVIEDEFGVVTGNETGVVEAIANHQVTRPGPYSQPQQMETDVSIVSISEVEETDHDNDNRVEVNKENESLPPGDDHVDNDKETIDDACNIDDRNSLVDLTPDNEDDNMNPKSIAEMTVVGRKMQIFMEENGHGGTSGNEAETAKVSMNNANTIEEVDVIGVDFDTATDIETETGVVESIAIHQVSPPGPYSQPHQMETDVSIVSISEVEETDHDNDNRVEVNKENESLPPGDDHVDNDKETVDDACNIDDRNSLVDRTPDNEDEDDNNRNSKTVDDKQMQIDMKENGHGETSENEAENAKVSMNNASTVEEVDVIGVDFVTATDIETETGMVVEAIANHQVSRLGPYSQPQQMETDESNSEVDVQSDYDCDVQVEVGKENDSLPPVDDDADVDNETGKDVGISISDDRSSQDGKDEGDLVDLTPDNEDKDGNRNPITVAEMTVDDKKMQIDMEENGHGETSGNEAETANVCMVNASTVTVDGVDVIGELDEVIEDDFGEDEVETGVNEVQVTKHQVYREPQEMDTEKSDPEVQEESSDDDKQVVKGKGSLPSEDNEKVKAASDSEDKSGQDREENRNDGKAVASSFLDKSERRLRNPMTMTVADAGPGQFDLREPYPNEDYITLNGKQIRWHWMEALPSLTSPKLLHERMRVFTLDIIKQPRESIRTEIRSLFESLPENSLEKRLGMMAVQCENYKEIGLDQLLQSSKDVSVCEDPFPLLNIKYVELVATERIRGEASIILSGSKPSFDLQNKIFQDDSDRYSLANYESIMYGNKAQANLMEISNDNIEGLEDRAKALIKMNSAGRTVTIRCSMSPHLEWHEDFSDVSTEIGGVGWDVLPNSWTSDFTFNATGTQILFPMLVKDIELAKKVRSEEILKQNLDSRYYCQYIALSPKYLLDNEISCFPVVQTPGILIYKHKENVGLPWTNGISKSILRLTMGAEITL